MKLKKLPPTKALIKVEREEKTSGGVFVPDETNAKETAIVLQVGKEVKEFKVGERILFKTWSVSSYKVDGEEFAILDEEHWDGTL